MYFRSEDNRSLRRRLVEKFDDAITELRARRSQRRRQRTEAGRQRVQGLLAQDLMYRFESLGDNCEFGLVQRQCGAEPLGLFRFATIDVHNLARVLDVNLVDIEDPEAIDVFLSNGRFVAHHRGYDAKYGHTGFGEDDLSPERIRVLMLQRLKFLARKLREILSEGEKILVCRTRYQEAADGVLRAGEALQRLGPNLLLWVASTDTPAAVGSVECVGKGVLKGMIEADSDWDRIRLDTWMSLCERAYVHWCREGYVR